MTALGGGKPYWLTHRPLALGKRALVGLPVLVAGLSLAGIGFLLWFHVQQNALAAEVYQEMAAQANVDGPLTPVELAELSHHACFLDSGISNIQSFLQPLGTTLSEGGWCGNYVRVFIAFAAQEGYPAHKFHIQSDGRSHTLAEVYYDGQWRIIDPFFNLVYLRPDGDMATFEELRENPEWLETPVQRPMLDPHLYRIYGSYEPIFPDLYRDAAEFHPGLSRSAFYHNAFVAVGYPLAPFYEGERRPFLPNWLDRPELLGIYGLSGMFLLSVSPLVARQFRLRRASTSD